MSTDLDTLALWGSLSHEERSHAQRLMVVKKPYEALRVLHGATGSGRQSRALVAWLAQAIIRGES